MKVLETLIPPPLVALIFALALWGLASLKLILSFDGLISDEVRYVGSALLLVIGLLFSISGVVSFKRAKTTVNPLKPEEASSLVSTGIYRFTRNPMYVGFIFILSAWSIFLASLLFIFIVPAFMLYLTFFQIIPEERALNSLFGEAFTTYQTQVRRWL